MRTLQEVKDMVIAGKAKLVGGKVQEALDEGVEAQEIPGGLLSGRRER